MGKLSGIRKRHNQFVKDAGSHLAEAVDSVQEEILDLNRDQLSQGLTSKGKIITPLYSEKYAKKKGFDVPDLKVTGDFQDAMFIASNENNKTYFTGSEDDKTQGLLKRYGEDVLGVPVKRIPEAQKKVVPVFRSTYKKKVFNG